MQFQRTIKKPISLTGVGLHSGKPVNIVIRPGSPDQGIVFIRTDLKDRPQIQASFENVTDTQLATTLTRGSASVSTVEHLLAAFAGCEIDNAIVEVEGPEVPIMDGSSIHFAELIQSVGTEGQAKTRRWIELLRRVEVRIGEKWAIAEPSNQFEIHASIEFDHSAIGFQEFTFKRSDKNAFLGIADARTFGFLKEVEVLHKLGLAKGGSLENAVVLNEAGVMNPEGLRHRDEFVRHKTLDALGDLKLSGFDFIAKFRFHRSGHDLHRQLVAEIMRNPSNYRIVDEHADVTSIAAEAASSPRRRVRYSYAY